MRGVPAVSLFLQDSPPIFASFLCRRLQNDGTSGIITGVDQTMPPRIAAGILSLCYLYIEKELAYLGGVFHD